MELNERDTGHRKKELFETAITAIKEIQQYREIGTVEEIKDLLMTISEASEEVDESGINVGFIKDLIQLGEYRKIGTVEECREAVEKQKPSIPIKTKDGNLACKCGFVIQIKNVRKSLYYCTSCGRKIDWDSEPENWEGMEDE